MNESLSKKCGRVNLAFILILNLLMVSLFVLQNLVYKKEVRKLLQNKQQSIQKSSASAKQKRAIRDDLRSLETQKLAEKRLASLDFWDLVEDPSKIETDNRDLRFDSTESLANAIRFGSDEMYPTEYNTSESPEISSSRAGKRKRGSKFGNKNNRRVFSKIFRNKTGKGAVEITDQEKEDIWNCTSLNLGCNITPSIKHNHEYFRLISSVFLHDSLFHLTVNVIFSLLYYPRDKFLIGQFFCVILLLNLFSAFKFPNNVKIGFSGFALFCFGYSFLDQLSKKKIFLLGD